MNILKILTDRRLRGNLGERAAVRFLKRAGFRILEKNFTTENSEIDIIAKDRETTVFVEVKTRSISAISPKEPRPASSVTPEKQRKIISASAGFMRKRRIKTRMRYDVIEVYLENVGGKDKVKEIRHLVNTFDLNSAYDKKFYHGN